MKTIIVAMALMLVLSGCTKTVGCGNVVGGNTEYGIHTNYYYLNVKFGTSVKKVYVDQKTYLDYHIGSQICF
jgi:hypothetical protein